MQKSIEVPQLEEYYHFQVTIVLQRIQLLALVGAGILALKHPGFTGPSADLVRDILKQFVPLIYHHTPREVLLEWDRVLGSTPGGE